MNRLLEAGLPVVGVTLEQTDMGLKAESQHPSISPPPPRLVLGLALFPFRTTTLLTECLGPGLRAACWLRPPLLPAVPFALCAASMCPDERLGPRFHPLVYKAKTSLKPAHALLPYTPQRFEGRNCVFLALASQLLVQRLSHAGRHMFSEKR